MYKNSSRIERLLEPAIPQSVDKSLYRSLYLDSTLEKVINPKQNSMLRTHGNKQEVNKLP